MNSDRERIAVILAVSLFVVLLFVCSALYDKSMALNTVCALRPDPTRIVTDPKTPQETADAICAEALGWRR